MVGMTGGLVARLVMLPPTAAGRLQSDGTRHVSQTLSVLFAQPSLMYDPAGHTAQRVHTASDKAVQAEEMK